MRHLKDYKFFESTFLNKKEIILELKDILLELEDIGFNVTYEDTYLFTLKINKQRTNSYQQSGLYNFNYYEVKECLQRVNQFIYESCPGWQLEQIGMFFGFNARWKLFKSLSELEDFLKNKSAVDVITLFEIKMVFSF